MTIWIKICGITRGSDAETAARLGADAVGFVFVPSSPRYCDPAEARAIGRNLPLRKVGVFVDASLDEIRRARDDSGIDCVQLHGREPPDFCARVETPVIKAFCDSLARANEYEAFAILADGIDPLPIRKPLIIAGGLSLDNVASAIRLARPFGVDVARGVESAPGIKDDDSMRRFIEAARGVEC